MNQPGGGRVALDFLAKPKNINVYGTVRDRAILAPDGVQELLPDEDEQHQVRAGPAAQVERATTGLRTADRKAFFFQVVLKQGVQVGVVFNENDAFGHEITHSGWRI